LFWRSALWRQASRPRVRTKSSSAKTVVWFTSTVTIGGQSTRIRACKHGLRWMPHCGREMSPRPISARPPLGHSGRLCTHTCGEATNSRARQPLVMRCQCRQCCGTRFQDMAQRQSRTGTCTSEATCAATALTFAPTTEVPQATALLAATYVAADRALLTPPPPLARSPFRR
jgi:hypothetical protein